MNTHPGTDVEGCNLPDRLNVLACKNALVSPATTYPKSKAYIQTAPALIKGLVEGPKPLQISYAFCVCVDPQCLGPSTLAVSNVDIPVKGITHGHLRMVAAELDWAVVYE